MLAKLIAGGGSPSYHRRSFFFNPEYMKMYLKSLPFAAVTAVSFAAPALAHERAVEFPQTADGGVILAADLHTHSVFSDGEVWPSIRVEEAQRDGLEMLSLTEHLEHQPKRADIPHPDRNRSYEVAVESLEKSGDNNLFIVKGAEVTRSHPHGHINAVFLEDANKLLVDDPREALVAARKQDAFVFLNHPNWIPQKPDGIAILTEYHKGLIRDGLLQGIEVANGTLDGHSEHALQIALDNNLTVMGTSDIHGLVDWTHNAGHGGHSPMTLVLATEKSPEAMKAALFAGNTVAWNYDDLLGKPENVGKLVRACLSLETDGYPKNTSVLPVDIVNVCPVNFILQNLSDETFQTSSDVIRIERDSRFTVAVRMGEIRDEVALTFDVLNTQTGFRKSLELMLATDVLMAK